MFRNIRNRELGKKVKLPSLKLTLLKTARALNKEIGRKLLVAVYSPSQRTSIMSEVKELQRQLAANKKFFEKNFK